jgi:hypothetical protein
MPPSPNRAILIQRWRAECVHSLGPKDRGCAFLRGSCDRKCNRLGYPSDVRDCHQRAHAGAAEPPGRTLSRAPWPLIETANSISPEFHTECNLKM